MFAASKTAAAAAGAPPSSNDPQFNYVTMLLHGDGTNGAQNNTFVDSSTNNFTITRNGTPTQGSFSPYGTLWSNNFSGSGQYLTTSSVTFAGDFTVEGWVFIANLSGNRALVQIGDDSTSTGPLFYVSTSGKFSVYAASALITGSATIAANAWVHLAVCRSGSTVKSYVNGVLDTTITNSTTFTGAVRVGAEWYTGTLGGTIMNGYISNLRLVTGTALYTSNFTPSTTPLTAVSGTSLLTCQSNRFRDNSSNNFAITVTGTPSVQRFSPFDPAAEYSTSVIGGSGYFNGSGNYLTTPSITLGTSSFTFEAWVYRTAAKATEILASGTTSGGFNIGFESTGTVIEISRYNVAYIAQVSATVPLNQWFHIAATRDGNSYRIFLNGVQVGTTVTDSNSIPASAYRITDSATSGNNVTGYVSNLRIVTGTALYTANFTPPTAPLTAITNTSLLLNCVNAGIYDNAMMNDLVTVGDAQVSTAVVKYGTGSMKFDGTGDWLTFVDSPNAQLGSGDFTIEGWVNLSLLGSARGIFSKGTSTTGLSLAVNALNQVVFNYTASSLTGTTVLMATTWYHIAVVRSGSATGNVKIYINGTADATSAGAITDNFNQTNSGYIGADRIGTSPMNGYIDDLRITKGYARYTANFTPPTAAFPNY